MRSRNGHRPLSLAICAVVLAPHLWADEYIISYRAVIRNAVMVSESFNISRSMQKCRGIPASSVFLDANGSTNLHQILSNQYETFFSLMQQETLHIEHHENNINTANLSHTVFTMPPQCFTVDINEDFAKITALKEGHL